MSKKFASNEIKICSIFKSKSVFVCWGCKCKFWSDSHWSSVVCRVHWLVETRRQWRYSGGTRGKSLGSKASRSRRHRSEPELWRSRTETAELSHLNCIYAFTWQFASIWTFIQENRMKCFCLLYLLHSKHLALNLLCINWADIPPPTSFNNFSVSHRPAHRTPHHKSCLQSQHLLKKLPFSQTFPPQVIPEEFLVTTSRSNIQLHLTEFLDHRQGSQVRKYYWKLQNQGIFNW